MQQLNQESVLHFVSEIDARVLAIMSAGILQKEFFKQISIKHKSVKALLIILIINLTSYKKY